MWQEKFNSDHWPLYAKHGSILNDKYWPLLKHAGTVFGLVRTWQIFYHSVKKTVNVSQIGGN